jgi:3-deoxy-D-manno-octulosonate 8-phosphate phosphatase (KDO 8-P phosphatase)
LKSKHSLLKPPPKLAASFAKLGKAKQSRLADVKFLVMDIDGVLTDSIVYFSDNGPEFKGFSSRDGYALSHVVRYGLLRGVISGRVSKAAVRRCKELKFDEIHMHTVKKIDAFNKILKKRKLSARQAAFIGDDVMDLQVMRVAGLSAAPSDAQEEVRQAVDILLDFPAGHGAVRQFLDFWLLATGHYEQAMKDILDGKL